MYDILIMCAFQAIALKDSFICILKVFTTLKKFLLSFHICKAKSLFLINLKAFTDQKKFSHFEIISLHLRTSSSTLLHLETIFSHDRGKFHTEPRLETWKEDGLFFVCFGRKSDLGMLHTFLRKITTAIIKFLYRH